MIHIRLTGTYRSMYYSLILINPKYAQMTAQKVLMFAQKPYDSRLKNHSLQRRMKGKWAFSVDDDVRIIYQWSDKKTARFLAIGGHEIVYGRKNNK